MARQPFLPTYRGTPMAIGPDLIDNLPRLAELVGRIAINWSGVELHLALLLGSMLGVENSASVAVFTSLRNHRAQRDALKAAASKTLTGEDHDFFSALIIVHQRLDAQRNDTIHCVWGTGSKTPDGIVWTSLQDHAATLITSYHREATKSLSGQAEHLTKDVFVVFYADLEKLNSQIRDFARAIASLHIILRYRGTRVSIDSTLHSLRNEPLIREALMQMRSSGEKNR